MSKRETPSRSSIRPGRKSQKRRISDASESLGKPEAKRIQRDPSETEEIRSKVALQKLARPMPTDDFVNDADRRKRVREILLHILSKLKFKVYFKVRPFPRFKFRTQQTFCIRNRALFSTRIILLTLTLT